MRVSTQRLVRQYSTITRAARQACRIERLEGRTLLSATWGTVDDYQLAAGHPAVAKVMATDPQGDVFLAGAAQDGAGVSHFLIREKLNGVEGWTNVAEAPFDVNGLAVDGAHNIYISGSRGSALNTSWTVMECLAGQTTFNQVDQIVPTTLKNGQTVAYPSPGPLTIDPQGNVFAEGIANGVWTVRRRAGGVGAFATVDTFHSDTDGQVFPTCIATVATGPAAGVYVVGDGSSPTHWFVRRSTNGGNSWATIDAFQYSTANNARTARAVGVVGDANGNLYVTGWSMTATPTGGTKRNPTYAYAYYGVTRKGVVDASGIWTWTNIDLYSISRESIPDYGGVAVDAKGNVFTTQETLTQDVSGNYTIGRATIRSNEDGYWHNVDDYQLTPGLSADYLGLVSDGSGTVYAFGGARDSAGIKHLIVRSPTPPIAPATFSSSTISSANAGAPSTPFFSQVHTSDETPSRHGRPRAPRLRVSA